MDERPRLTTRLCEVLGTEYPIIQSGMGGVAGVDLAAEVCEAGGLGVLAGVLAPPDAIRAAIRDLRARTTRPFGVNLLLASDLRPPASAESLSDEAVEQVHSALNPIRKDLDLPPIHGRPKAPPDLVSSAIEVILEERVPVFSIGLGDPGPELVGECHRRGIKVMAMVSTVADAMAVEDSGVDVIVAQGGEAGGHRSHFTKPPSPQHAAVGCMALIPEIAAAVRVPVVAAGGIVDGRGLVAALALGASGVLMGTRFVATQESTAPEIHKKALLERTSEDTTLTDAFSGRYARAIRNRYTEGYASSGAPVLPFFWQLYAAGDIFQAAVKREDAEYLPLWAGQSVGLVQSLPTAAEVVSDTVAQAHRLLRGGLAAQVRLD